MQNKIKYVVAAIAAAAFVSAAYYLPAETFLAAFAGGLFLIPASFFVYMMHTVAKA